MLRFIFLNRIRPLRKNIINYFLSFKKLSSFFLIVLFTLFQIIYFTLSVYQNSNIQLNPAKPTQSDLTCLKKSNIWTNAGYSLICQPDTIKLGFELYFKNPSKSNSIQKKEKHIILHRKTFAPLTFNQTIQA